MREQSIQTQIFHYAFPFLLILIVWEIRRYRRLKRPFPYGEALVSFLMAMANQAANVGGAHLIKPISGWVYEHRLFTVPMDHLWSWLLLFVGLEFFYYWMHRCAHEIRWIWANHSVHHSPTTISFSGAYRLGVTSTLSGVFLFFLPLSWLGFPPDKVTIMFSCNLLYQFWLHTDQIGKLGWFEKIFNTPSHHRVHHAMESIYLDRNHGGVLIVFDKLFGTFQEERDEVPKTYGLIGKKPTLNPFLVMFQEWLAMMRDVWAVKNPGMALKVLFSSPQKAALIVEKQVLDNRPSQDPARLGGHAAYRAMPPTG